MQNRHRVLVISRNDKLRHEMVTLLSGYGYFVEHCRERNEGMKLFRAFKQSIIIMDVPGLRRFSRRIFKMITSIQKNAIILVAAYKSEEQQAFHHLKMGAYDILNLPLRTEFLFHTIQRATDNHKQLLENMFIKNTLFFGLLMMPLWLLTAYLLIK